MTPARPKPVPRKREAVKVYADGREVCSQTAAGRSEYLNRTRKAENRQWGMCAICGQPFTPWLVPTLDHQEGRGMNGAHRDDRLWIDGKPHNAALCVPCQGIKGSKRYEWREGKYVPKSWSDYPKHTLARGSSLLWLRGYLQPEGKAVPALL